MKLYVFVLLVVLATIALAQEDAQLDETPQSVNDFDGVRLVRSPNRYYYNQGHGHHGRPHSNHYYGNHHNRPHGGGHHNGYKPQYYPNRYIG
ncbi:Hypothetical predicted protein [Cloeon dipterum]|uniref:Uncharacterized protein n=1 Tax=Cloeon dipterum TaxID=197152 RepID=A0A8S1BWB8_9INSE|nr:Hypothetical predicted protein [Cloeon dipterum]